LVLVFLSLEPKKPNRTEKTEKTEPNRKKIELNQAKPVRTGFYSKKPNRTKPKLISVWF
jgi:hypothetical protein